jgi:D-aspartate ligase
VLLMGGDEIALSVARSLRPLGVRAFALSFPHHPIRYSRHAEWIRLPGTAVSFWQKCADFLRGPESDRFAGSVLLATQDEAIAILADHRTELQKKFLLDRSNPSAQKLMLDKLATYRAAREAGVPTPRFWYVTSLNELGAVAGELTFPLIVKPRHGHLFKARFRIAKHIVARSLDDVYDALAAVTEAGLEAFLVETIPGPDSLLCSYYTYLDESGRAYFDFTKRIIRRYPKNMGQATYHVTGPVPRIKDLSLRLLRHVGLQGVANVEFKLDRRDGVYKLIECNGRFTGGNPLVLKSGMNIAELVYSQITGLPCREFGSFRSGVHMVYPWRDFAAYRELNRLNELGFGEWLQSLMYPQTFPIWSWRDPGPAVMPLIARPAQRLRGELRRIRQGRTPAFCDPPGFLSTEPDQADLASRGRKSRYQSTKRDSPSSSAVTGR